jgi:hypothetical protein
VDTGVIIGLGVSNFYISSFVRNGLSRRHKYGGGSAPAWFRSRGAVATDEEILSCTLVRLCVSAVSGFVLTIIDIRKWLGDPLFYIKIGFIALAMITGRLIWNRAFRDASGDDIPIATSTKALAAASLFLWMAAITAGRLTAYLFMNSGLTAGTH